MSRYSQPSGEAEETEGVGRSALGEWAESRATVLLAIGVLMCLLAVLIVVSLLHPR